MDEPASGAEKSSKTLTLSDPLTAFAAAQSREPDCVVLCFELEDGAALPGCAPELQFNANMQRAGESQDSGVESLAVLSKQALGMRSARDITIETYTPTGAAVGEDMTHSHLQAAAIPGAAPTSASLEPKHPIPRDRVSFFSGIPAVECIKGVLHLYRHKPTAVSELVCVMNIPAEQQLSDMLSFLSPVDSTIHSLRVIRDSTPNEYMLLIKFKDMPSAEKFFQTYNGRYYNTLEKTVCQLVYVRRVEIKKSSQGASLPSPGLTELPSCPVCLERLDDSVLTILCNHSFHTNCLTRWEDSTCPVCRYTQTPEPSGENTCLSCDSKEDLWICLICGNIGCGRYVGGHSHNHFVETQHTFAMQLGTQRVWDYIGDNYVHRIVQNKADGKLVEVSGQGGMVADDEKIDSLQLEYTYLLTSQLESQRLFFEEKLARVEKEANEQLAVVETRCRNAVSAKQDLEEHISELEKEKKTQEKKLQQLNSRVVKLTADLKEERELNKCLSENQKLWKDRVGALETKLDITLQQKEKEMKDLQEQVRDLMFYLETQKKIQNSPQETRQEIQEGHLVVTQGASGRGGATGHTPARKGKKKR